VYEVKCTLISTICRLLNFDLKLTRKILVKRAREALPSQRKIYFNSLNQWYSYSEQFIFVDETSTSLGKISKDMADLKSSSYVKGLVRHIGNFNLKMMLRILFISLFLSQNIVWIANVTLNKYGGIKHQDY
jgi:hypothetical protein